MKVRSSVIVAIVVLLTSMPVSAQVVAGRNAACVGTVDAPVQVLSGKTFQASLTMQNTGTVPWTSASKYFLGSSNDFWWGLSRVNVPATINTNQTAKFAFTATAPINPGTYNFTWKMLQEGVTWFGAACAKPITVVSAANNAQGVSINAPKTVPAGQPFSATVIMKNNSFVPWTKQDGYKLGSETPKDNARWGLGRVEVSKTIQPGESETFTISAMAPLTRGSYKFDWRMLKEGQEWFGALATTDISVIAPLNNADFVSMTVPETLKVGDTFRATVVMKNTGTQAWTKNEPYAHRLGSQTPPDNRLWGQGRMNLINNVSVGAQATFSGEFTAPATPGVYQFDWKMVQEGKEWFGPLASKNITVQPNITPTPTPHNPYPYDAEQAAAKFITPQMGALIARLKNVAVQLQITLPIGETVKCGDWSLEKADGTTVPVEWVNNQPPATWPSCSTNPYP